MRVWILSAVNFASAGFAQVLDGVALHINSVTGILLGVLGLLEVIRRIKRFFSNGKTKNNTEKISGRP